MDKRMSAIQIITNLLFILKISVLRLLFFFFFLNDPPPPEIPSLPLPAALPTPPARGEGSAPPSPPPPFHLGPVVVADEVQEPVHERLPPGLADDLRAQDRVTELARQPGLERLTRVDRKGEHVGHLIDAQVVPLEGAHLVRPDEMQAELTFLDPFLG